MKPQLLGPVLPTGEGEREGEGRPEQAAGAAPSTGTSTVTEIELSSPRIAAGVTAACRSDRDLVIAVAAADEIQAAPDDSDAGANDDFMTWNRIVMLDLGQ